MKNNALSITSLVLVLLGFVGVTVLFVFKEQIRHIDWLDRQKVAWLCFGMTTIGGVLGWISFRRPLGKVSAIFGTLGVLGFFSVLLSSSAPAPAPMPAQTKSVESHP